MRTMLMIVLLGSMAVGQDLPAEDPITQIGNKKIPDGLLETDIKKVQQKRIDAAQRAVDVLQMKYQQGLVHLSVVLDAQIDLLNAKLESAANKEERLKHLFDLQASALLIWQRANQLQQGGIRGGEPDQVELAAAQLFRFRVMWLKEKQAK